MLDYKSDPATRGKNLGDDLAEGKPTLPLLHALRHGNDEQRALIRLAIEQGGLAQFGPIVEAIEATGGLDYAAGFAQRETAQALAALEVTARHALLARASVPRALRAGTHLVNGDSPHLLAKGAGPHFSRFVS